MAAHKTGTREEWLAARLELLEAEKALTRRSDELARWRQELPWVRIDKDYRFETGEGTASLKLAGKPALERLRREVAALSSGEQELAARGLLAGLVIDENRPEYDTGDFLMRGLLGADEATGALALGDTARAGQTLRFFVRDAVFRLGE